MHLPLKIRLKLLRQEILATLRIAGHTRVKIADHPLGAAISVFDGEVIVPSPWRWKLYRKGWAARLDQLEREYGVGKYITLNADSTILDVGANAGEFAHIAARYGARIFCAEPDDAVRACLQHNISSLSTASAHDALFWKEQTDLAFTSIPDHADSSVFGEHQEKSQLRRTTTIDDFCQTNAIDKLEFIKCDAEGAEPEVLQGATRILSSTQAIAVDTGAERKGNRTHIECKSILENAGFTVIDEAVDKRLMTYGVRT